VKPKRRDVHSALIAPVGQHDATILGVKEEHEVLGGGKPGQSAAAARVLSALREAAARSAPALRRSVG
jgi:hypothetical protein